MPEFSKRVNIEVFQDEPLSFADWWEHVDGVTPVGNFYKDDAAARAAHADYLNAFQPYRWHAKAANNKLIGDGESYHNLAHLEETIDLAFGDDTTVYAAHMFGEDRGLKLLRYGVTDRNAQGDDSPEQASE